MSSLPLNANQKRWVDYIRENVVGQLAGDSNQRARTAAVVTWWALKEGVLDLKNPWRHNLCAGGGGQRQIGDLETCPGAVWQLGMSGIQPSAVGLVSVENVARSLFPGDSISSTLARVAEDAGLDASSARAVENSEGELRKAWLLRDPAISFELQRPFVERCLRSRAPSWCFGSWPSARAFASNASQIQSTIAALESDFQGAPGGKTSLLPWVLLLGSAALLAYGLRQTSSAPKWLKGFRFS